MNARETEHTAEAVVQRFNMEVYGIQEAEIFAMVPPAIPGLGSYRRPATPIGRPPQPRRHRDAACCRDLDGALPQLSGTGIGQQPVPSQCTAIFFEYRPRQGTVDGYPAEQCIHRLGLLYGEAYVNDYVQFGHIYQVKLGRATVPSVSSTMF